MPTRVTPTSTSTSTCCAAKGLLLTIDRPVDKDSELHPLVRWQYVGGIEEHERKAFLFTNVVDALGRKYKFPVVVGAYAGNRADLLPRHERARRRRCSRGGSVRPAQPIAPRVVEDAACQEVVITGDALQGRGQRSRCAADSGLDARASTARRR